MSDPCPYCGTPLDGSVPHETTIAVHGDRIAATCTVRPQGHLRSVSGIIRWESPENTECPQCKLRGMSPNGGPCGLCGFPY